MPDTRLILHIKGTESQTAELPKAVVKAGIKQGQISRSQLIWSEADNAWKQVRELPHLLPSQQIAPAPAQRVGTVPLPHAAQPTADEEGQGEAAVESEAEQTGPVPKIAKPVVRGGPPGFRAAAAARAAKVSAPAKEKDLVVKEEGGTPYLKWFCVGLALLILVVVGINGALVGWPLYSAMKQTPYAKVPAYGHFAAFVQPNELIIHLPSTSTLNSANLPEFLQTLAHSTPDSPLGGAYDHVLLTTGWTGRYCIAGSSWKHFGEMADEDDEAKQSYLLDQLEDSSGQPLLSASGGVVPSEDQKRRDQAWTDFVNYFTKQ